MKLYKSNISKFELQKHLNFFNTLKETTENNFYDKAVNYISEKFEFISSNDSKSFGILSSLDGFNDKKVTIIASFSRTSNFVGISCLIELQKQFKTFAFDKTIDFIASYQEISSSNDSTFILNYDQPIEHISSIANELSLQIQHKVGMI